MEVGKRSKAGVISNPFLLLTLKPVVGAERPQATKGAVMNKKRLLALLITLGIPGVPWFNYCFIPPLLEATSKEWFWIGIIILLFIPWFYFLMYGFTGRNIFKNW